MRFAKALNNAKAGLIASGLMLKMMMRLFVRTTLQLARLSYPLVLQSMYVNLPEEMTGCSDAGALGFAPHRSQTLPLFFELQI